MWHTSVESAALITTRGLHSHYHAHRSAAQDPSRRVIAVAAATVLLLLGVVSYTAAPAVLVTAFLTPRHNQAADLRLLRRHLLSTRWM